MRTPDAVSGILLAAGRGSRFDPAGAANKLMQPFAGDDSVAVAAAKNLLAALPSVLAVVRPGADALAADLRAAGCVVSVCSDADQGMGVSLVHGLRQTQGAAGWVIALADMPAVRPRTIEVLLAALAQGAGIAAPLFDGRRGNPVAFGRALLPRLLALGGDQGARALLRSLPVTEVPVDDPGILQDVDTRDDLAALR